MNSAAPTRTKIYLYRTNHVSIGSQNFTDCSKYSANVTVKFSDFIVQCTEHSK